MPPVQPRPTMTASTSLSFVAMPRLPLCLPHIPVGKPLSVFPAHARPLTHALAENPALAHVGNADGIVGEWLVAKLLDVFAVHRDRAWKADQFPARLVTVAAVDRVREHAFHDGLVERAPEDAHRRPRFELDPGARERLQHFLALGFIECIERLAIRLAAMRVCRR